MSQTPRPDNAAKLDEFLDRLLGPEEDAQVRRAIESDPEIKREAELQRWIDSELDEMFAYDSSPAPVIPHAEAPPPIPFKARPHLFRSLALAAVIVLSGVAVWIGVSPGRPGPAPVQYIAADTVYTRLIASGFKPDFVCTTDEEFKEATKKRFGSPLLLASSPGVTPLGWAYNAGFRGKIIGDKTMMLLTTVDDQNVLVLMDTTDRPADHPIIIPPGHNLRVFRRQVGPIFNYEITPFDSSRVIEKLYQPN